MQMRLVSAWSCEIGLQLICVLVGRPLRGISMACLSAVTHGNTMPI